MGGTSSRTTDTANTNNTAAPTGTTMSSHCGSAEKVISKSFCGLLLKGIPCALAEHNTSLLWYGAAKGGAGGGVGGLSARAPIQCVFPEWQARRLDIPFVAPPPRPVPSPPPPPPPPSMPSSPSASWYVPLATALRAPKQAGTIRLVCISDTHTLHSLLTHRIPTCDVLLHCGDFTDVGSAHDIESFCRWLREDVPQARRKVVIAGNHDLSLDNRHGYFDSAHARFGLPRPQSVPEVPANRAWLTEQLQLSAAVGCSSSSSAPPPTQSLSQSSSSDDFMMRAHNAPHLARLGAAAAQQQQQQHQEACYSPEVSLRRSCIYLDHEGVTLWYDADGNAHRHEHDDEGNAVSGLRIFGSPYQPEFYNWAFNLGRGRPASEEEGPLAPPSRPHALPFACCREAWSTMDAGCDVLMTHGPPLGHGDWVPLHPSPPSEGGEGQRRRLPDRYGCADLLDWVTAHRPSVHAFGHFHDGYGVTMNGSPSPHLSPPQASSSPHVLSSTLFVNASSCDEAYDPQALRDPIVIEVPVSALKPKGARGVVGKACA